MPLTLSRRIYMSIRNALFALPIIALAMPAFAQDAAIDTDGSSSYSFAELQVALPELTQEEFDAMDTNMDADLDAEEIVVAVESEMLVIAE